MNLLYSITDTHTKGKHLSFENRVEIQTLRKEGYSMRAIARKLNCSPSTIKYEIDRGTVTLYNGNVKRYHAKAGQEAYNRHRLNSGRKRSEEHTSELQSRGHLVCRLLLEKKKEGQS